MRIAAAILLTVSAAPVAAENVRGSLSVQWVAGAEDCSSDPGRKLQTHAYEPQTYILRQSPCADFEAPFMFLLVGSQKALLIDTGAVEDAAQMPLAESVLKLLPRNAGSILPLLVVHTHAHRDHFAADAQFAQLPNVQVIDPQVESVKAFFGFERWPEGTASLDLGGRIVTVLPAPGHESAHVVFYDDRTQLVFSGDFLLPGRLLIDDIDEYRRSAHRIADYFRDRPVAHVLGAHIELDVSGDFYPSGAEHHSNERPLELTKADLLALPAAADSFNGFYASHENYALTNPKRNALALLLAAAIVFAALIWGVRALIRRHRVRHG